MATSRRPQLGALFGGEAPAGDRPPGAPRLRAVTGTTDPADRPDPTGPTLGGVPAGDGPPGAPGAATVAPDAAPSASASAAGAGRAATPWSVGGWLDPLVVAARYFDFWQSVLDTNRRLVLGATATALGRPRPDAD